MEKPNNTNRRQFVAALSCCLLAWHSAQASANSMHQLAKACNTLCGTNVSDPQIVEQYLKVLIEVLTPKQLQELLDLAALSTAQIADQSRAPAIKESAEIAMQLWISGMTQGTNSQVLAYINAPVWSALSSFTKPPAVCGGGFGYWSAPPT